MALKSQPYRLDWLNIKSFEEANGRLSKLWVNTDEMLEILFKELRTPRDPTPHSPTHQPGGTDEFIVNLATGVSGVLPFSHLPVVSEGVLLGRGEGAGAGVIQEITLGTGLDMVGTVLNVTGSSLGGYWAPLTDGDVVETDLIFASGEAVMVWVPTP